MTDYAVVLSENYPDAMWELDGDAYDGLRWLSDSPKPTQAELDAAWPQVQYQQQRAEVETQRKNAYREEADPLFFSYQRGEVTEQEWLDKVAEIKLAYPYPEAP